MSQINFTNFTELLVLVVVLVVLVVTDFNLAKLDVSTPVAFFKSDFEA